MSICGRKWDVMERILVVDDEDKIRAIIRKYGEFEGYEIAEAHDGMEAVEICRKEDFDLIILDVMMPELDGFSTSRLAIPHMVHEKKGKIINISSVWGIAGASCEVAYSACKGGINSFTKALAKELAPSNIQVNAIACGVIDTQMNACFSEEERAELADEIPAGRFGTPEETAHLAVQLATGNEYLTGQIITLDGGWL